MKYNTKHRNEIIKYLKKNEDKHLTIQEIKEELKGKIPQATLYRLMDSLEQEGVVRKYIIGPSFACCYQYADCHHEYEHFHLVCQKCGKLIHLECDEVEHLVNHIKDDHGFAVDVTKVNLYGLCEDCQKENK